MARELRAALIAVVGLTLLLGLAYPLALTGAAQVAFPGRADGSLVEAGGQAVGSRIVGQDFSRDTGRQDADGEAILVADPRYFQSRPSATGYAPGASFFNNLGPNQQDLADLLTANRDLYLERERQATPGLMAADVPPDAVTTSASGVDPHVSEANARIQANRVAAERDLPVERVQALVAETTTRPLLGLGGERSVNVLELNLALDEEAP